MKDLHYRRKPQMRANNRASLNTSFFSTRSHLVSSGSGHFIVNVVLRKHTKKELGSLSVGSHSLVSHPDDQGKPDRPRRHGEILSTTITQRHVARCCSVLCHGLLPVSTTEGRHTHQRPAQTGIGRGDWWRRHGRTRHGTHEKTLAESGLTHMPE